MELLNLYAKELKNNNSTQENTLILFQKYKEGDQKAKDELIGNYLLLVVKIARKFQNRGVDLADLISEGNVGLLEALNHYDSSRGTFTSCATWWIRQSIDRNCFKNNRVVRLPENVLNLMATGRWTGTNYRECSIDKPNDEGDSMSESIPGEQSQSHIPFASEEAMIMKSKVERILSFLPNRDKEIVKACFGIDREKPLEIVEAAELFNLSTTRICQVLRQSKKIMRTGHNNLPESNTKEVLIMNAKYGSGEDTVDVTQKVLDLYVSEENIKASNRLGGDPCPGIVKHLTIQYKHNGLLLTKTFREGSVVKF